MALLITNNFALPAFDLNEQARTLSFTYGINGEVEYNYIIPGEFSIPALLGHLTNAISENKLSSFLTNAFSDGSLIPVGETLTAPMLLSIDSSYGDIPQERFVET